MLEFNKRIVWIPVVNASGETIPGGALMEPFADPPTHNGQDEDGNWHVRKPTSDGNTRVIVNGEAEIPDGETGQGHRDTQCVLLYDTTEDLPLSGDQYGSKSGSWQAHKDYAGFRIDHAGNGRANAQRVSAAASGASFSSFNQVGYNGATPFAYRSYNSYLGAEVQEAFPFPVYGTLGNLTISPGQTVRGNAVINVSASSGGLSIDVADPGELVPMVVTVFSKWNDTTNDTANRLTLSRYYVDLPANQYVVALNLPLLATNGTGSSRKLSAVVEIAQYGGGPVAGAAVVSTSTTFTLA